MFFFFKQKTAYEMRISDWSSDVCSSDLRTRRGFEKDGQPRHQPIRIHHRKDPAGGAAGDRDAGLRPQSAGARACLSPQFPDRAAPRQPEPANGAQFPAGGRSEEHTSELQSLMRISYAVFCLKKTHRSLHEDLIENLELKIDRNL